MASIIVYQFYQQEQAKQFMRDQIAQAKEQEIQGRIQELSAFVDKGKVNDCMKNMTNSKSESLLYCTEKVNQATLQAQQVIADKEQAGRENIFYDCLARYGFRSAIGVNETIMNECAKAK